MADLADGPVDVPTSRQQLAQVRAQVLVKQTKRSRRSGGIVLGAGKEAARDIGPPISRNARASGYENPSRLRGVSHMSLRLTDASGKSFSARFRSTP